MGERQKAKNQILHLLKTHGSQSAAALAKELQLSPMAVRQHLQALQAEKWVAYKEQRRTKGRPIKLWQLTEAARHFFPDSHADLIADLLRSVETVFGAAGLEKLLCERTRRQVQNYQSGLAPAAGGGGWQNAVAALAQFRTQEGYMAEVMAQPDGSLLLVENHCPVQAAARTCQLLCRCELEVFKTVLGTAVTVERVEHIMQGDRRCAYRVNRIDAKIVKEEGE
ncbi:helix-turn-helix transcriptional regulator [Kamptonema formosum]|uniref:helix-turn-helix transcriptional regulator n=1 Tax=Kamptonema formosum TaxID=331992 RepID=UPI000346338A|nr:metalloregulator ArsR/SmtB family transcription factor [Oscillatoria sp. PCC 10802]